MGRFKIRVVEYRDLEVNSDELVTLTEAANILDMSKPGVIRAIERGALTEVIDTEAGYHGHRLLFRREVEKFAKVRGQENPGAL